MRVYFLTFHPKRHVADIVVGHGVPDGERGVGRAVVYVRLRCLVHVCACACRVRRWPVCFVLTRDRWAVAMEKHALIVSL